ncbi:MAG: cysteine hydrolase [Oscillospiraceae bacterium]|nr:cysteine hydrolase [Oscillospiraceae bacterium]
MRRKSMNKAVIVIDMQYGFIDPASPLCIPYARGTVPACARVIAKAHESGIPVIFVNRSYREDGLDVEKTRLKTWETAKPMIPGAPLQLSAENPPELGRTPEDICIEKPRFSAFFSTKLDMVLRRMGIGHIYIMGTTTPNCIRTTCFDALCLDYDVSVLEDCTSSVTPEIQSANILDMKNIGAEILSSEEFCSA